MWIFACMRIDWTRYDEKKAKEIASSFADKTKADMLVAIQTMGLLRTKELLKSVKASVRSEKGEINRIQFTYQFYGRFLEKGTVKMQAKKWRDESIASNKPELDKQMAELYAQMMLAELEIESVKISL